MYYNTPCKSRIYIYNVCIFFSGDIEALAVDYCWISIFQGYWGYCCRLYSSKYIWEDYPKIGSRRCLCPVICDIGRDVLLHLHRRRHHQCCEAALEIVGRLVYCATCRLPRWFVAINGWLFFFTSWYFSFPNHCI